MSNREAKRRELLKPPNIKPVLTILTMLVCMFRTGKPEFAFIEANSVTPQAVSNAINQQNFAIVVKMLAATTGQMSIWIMLVNILFIWLFGSVVEKKLVVWRYPAFVFFGMILPYFLLGFDTMVDPKTMFTGPSLFTAYLMGGFMVFKPKKPFKPADWKPLPWKIFKGDENAGSQLKLRWVDPNIYMGMFVFWTIFLQVMLFIPKGDLVELCHTDIVGHIHSFVCGTLMPGRAGVMSPVSGFGSLALGALMAYMLVNIVTTGKVKRAASDLQVQAILQYRELRALDLNHVQAVEGTARLIGVPLDVAKEWISKGMQPTKEDQNT